MMKGEKKAGLCVTATGGFDTDGTDFTERGTGSVLARGPERVFGAVGWRGRWSFKWGGAAAPALPVLEG